MKAALHNIEDFMMWIGSMDKYQMMPLECAQAFVMFSKQSVLSIVNEFLIFQKDNIIEIRKYIMGKFLLLMKLIIHNRLLFLF